MISNTPRFVAPIARDPEQLVGGGGEARRGTAVRRAMRGGPRRRETERARFHRLGREAPHGRDLGVGGHLRVIGAAVAHHERAERGVRHLRAEVDRVRGAVDHVEVFGEALPSPRDPLVERGAGDVLDTLHQADQEIVTIAAHRRETHPAVPHDDGRDALPRRRRQQRVPRDLAVVVRVHVDPTRRDQQAVGVDLVATARAHLADVRDHDRRRSRDRLRDRERRCRRRPHRL